eukprot:scaffold24522_cov45-Prasinocladus_malaysianus.AAC.1
MQCIQLQRRELRAEAYLACNIRRQTSRYGTHPLYSAGWLSSPILRRTSNRPALVGHDNSTPGVSGHQPPQPGHILHISPPQTSSCLKGQPSIFP